jgi:membrane-associated phospholipid phosphatase
LSAGSLLVGWDRAAFHAINQGLACPAMDVAMPLFTDMGLGHVQTAGLLCAALGLAWARGEFRHAPAWAAARMALARRGTWLWPALIALALTGVAVQIPKRFHRQRPSWFYANERRQGRFADVRVHTIAGRRPLRVNGFPSGHTATTTAIALVLTLRVPRRRGYSALVASVWMIVPLVGLSRIYMADHWPLDVAGGLALGSLGGFAATRIPFGRRRGAVCDHDASDRRRAGGEAGG